MTYRLVEDVKELRKLSKKLTSRIAEQAEMRIRKEIGYPAGRFSAAVHFMGRAGEEVLWWSSSNSSDGTSINNFIGRGDPNGNSYLNIDLQFNIPISKFNRRLGGAFVRHLETGTVVLGHRGIVTRGHARIAKERLLERTDARMTRVVSLRGHDDIFLVATLDSDDLIRDIADFATDIRRAAIDVGGDTIVDAGTEPTDEQDDNAPEAPLALDLTIGDYFDEFVGKTKVAARRAVIADVRHGRVVHALKKAVEARGTLYKSKLIDLALETKKRAYLFEIKTATNTTSLYTAIGQLSLHGLALANSFGGRPLTKVLVLPSSLSAVTHSKFKQHLGIEVVSYEWQGSGEVIFNDLDLKAIV